MTATNHPLLDVSIVTYHPDQDELSKLSASLASAISDLPETIGPVVVRVVDNSGLEETALRILTTLNSAIAYPHSVKVHPSPKNLGFGSGHNHNLAQSQAKFLLLLNQDIELQPGALTALLSQANNDAAGVAAWEMRQIPYEHPKDYDPVNLDTGWVSGAAALFRRDAMNSVGGFDSYIFMYGEDVDLSWRLRAGGWRLRYLPRCAVIHRTYQTPGEIKRLQVLGGTLTNLCLRTRYGGGRRALQGLSMMSAEMMITQAFPGRRLGLFLNLFRFANRLPYFWRTRICPTDQFHPHFSGWDYELRREGAFFEFPTHEEWQGIQKPLVSILIRTIGRLAWLREALTSVANQTYRNLEVILVEDGPATCDDLVKEFSKAIPIQYEALGARHGRSFAGNRALAIAAGEWIGFLDDDDVFFADHIEVCILSALRNHVSAVYAIGWETHTRTHDKDNADYTEELHLVRHAQPFDRVTLWHHNYLPIQTVLFHRRLYEKHGGFVEDMDQLEDWNLWTRFSLEDDFLFIPKVTSKYRVPCEQSSSIERQKSLDDAYQSAVNRQAEMRFTMTPTDFSIMVDRHISARSLASFEIPHPRRWLRQTRFASWILARRQLLRRVARRFGISA